MSIPLQDQRRNYLERIAYLAYFFFETLEESGGDGHSVLINLVNPVPGKLKMPQLRKVILQELIRDKRSSGTPFGITDTAIETAIRLRSIGASPFECDDEAVLLKSICARYEHSFSEVHSKEELRSRRSQRLVRLLWLMHAHGVGAHSRALQFIFPDHEILIGRSPKAPSIGYHPEHVVPCAFIRDEAFRRFGSKLPLVPQGQFQEDTVSMLEMNRLVQRLMAVAYIHPAERDKLDRGKGAMKTTMPEDWNPDSGDILDRLRIGAEIDVLLPA